MNTLASNRKARALTLIETLVVVAVAALLVVFVLPAAWRKTQRIDCVNNLVQIGLAFRLWSDDHTNQFPMSVSTNFGGTREYTATGETFQHFQVMSNEVVSLKVLVCPADKRQPAKSWATLSNSNISYFVSLDADETQPQALLAGDRNLQIDGAAAKPGLLLLRTNSVVGWTHEMHNGFGNVALADGSVQQFSSAKLREAVANSRVTNRLVIP